MVVAVYKHRSLGCRENIAKANLKVSDAIIGILFIRHGEIAAPEMGF
jgi:hypothetical protein